ncbi:hypothetical protein OIU79_021582 [Salix purpurea]|uniref:Uncharacterized protein n=1 Tax=Salix purpurea TaxID=77065 RepID=A0A9Q0WDS3_SALPP|nr:hypothetical protein OIU79_021582 [Salix purpurea]
MASPRALKFVCLVVCAVVMAASTAKAAISCNQVVSALTPLHILCSQQRGTDSAMLPGDQGPEQRRPDHAGPSGRVYMLEEHGESIRIQ